MKNFFFLLFIFLSSKFSFAQDKIEIGTYVANDSLSYINILDENRFTYLKYYKWSPYTIRLEKQKVKENSVCGVIGYVSDGKGEGFYKIENGKISLDFITSQKGISNNEIVALTFNISQLIKE